ncbi:MAG: beta-lactamase family protein [Acidobacteriia bacterium]|nr:beta-lactamase family protein [Terriglobia bacterium]
MTFRHRSRGDAPVARYLPAFAMSDPDVTHEMTVRDLLVHRSGLCLGAGDLLWWPESTYNRKEVADRLRYIPLATSFRSADAYVTFALNPDGTIDQVKMRAVSPSTDFSFDFQDLLLKPVR